jgi:hypothetical protein
VIDLPLAGGRARHAAAGYGEGRRAAAAVLILIGGTLLLARDFAGVGS